MFEAINGMMLDMLAAVARKDYDDRRRRQAQGQAKAKAEGRYKGRPEDAERNVGIARMLDAGQSWGSIQRATGCSRDHCEDRQARQTSRLRQGRRDHTARPRRGLTSIPRPTHQRPQAGRWRRPSAAQAAPGSKLDLTHFAGRKQSQF
jgi:hypothetical protein